MLGGGEPKHEIRRKAIQIAFNRFVEPSGRDSREGREFVNSCVEVRASPDGCAPPKSASDFQLIMNASRALLSLMIVYGAASLLHFVHNGVYLYDYPNLPGWITPFGIYASWCVVAGIGVLGYWMYTRGSRALGLTAVAVYALLGYDGLDHYAVAPVGAHSFAMNATILAEVITASVLLFFVGWLIAAGRKPRPSREAR